MAKLILHLLLSVSLDPKSITTKSVGILNSNIARVYTNNKPSKNWLRAKASCEQALTQFVKNSVKILRRLLDEMSLMIHKFNSTAYELTF